MARTRNLLDSLNKIGKETLKRQGKLLTDAQIEERYFCEMSLYLFAERAWPLIEGGNDLIPAWHIQAVCEHLEALYTLQINRLIINLPPRMGKSGICSVLFPAWVWTKSPHQSFLYSAYAQTLSIRDSLKCRRLIQSGWYQTLWGDKVTLTGDMNSKLRFENTASGYRIASSVGGSNTGFGAHYDICDDPNNIFDTGSDIIREGVNEWHDYVMSSRHAGIASDFRRLVVQQRTHYKDVTGNILAKDDQRWIHLRLPMEFEKNYPCRTIPLRMSGGKIFKDPRKKEGELLWPAGMNAQELDLFKKKDFKSDSYRIAGQLQQRPSPEGGGIIKKEWFRPWMKRTWPAFEYTLQSWDTALTSGKNSCYSACTTWGVFKDDRGIYNVMLLSSFRGRLEYPDLRKMATRLSYNYQDTDIENPIRGHYPPDLVLIEEKVSGYSLLSDLMRANIPVMKFNPNRHGDKIGRCRVVTHIIENGLVWLPTEAPKHELLSEESQHFLYAASLFPNDESNDLIDSMSQAFIRLMGSGWLSNKDDPVPVDLEPWKKNKPYT